MAKYKPFVIIAALCLTFAAFTTSGAFAAAIIIDHTCTKLNLVPQSYITAAKANLRLSYGHTSHGSQIVSGMEVLMALSALYSFDHDGGTGVLSLWDYTPDGDLGNPDLTTWATRTREMLNTPGCDRNVVVWSWCGQLSWMSQAEVTQYLTLMNQLEADYPGVHFVYMTGHLDGSGVEGSLNQRNEQIRTFCRNYSKNLFDFADIESYDPSGNYFLDKYANDNCDYIKPNGSEGNWAVEWCAANPGQCSSCSCAHSQSLNCDQKGKAFWWLLARLAGWSGTTSVTPPVNDSNEILLLIPRKGKTVTGMKP